MASMAMISVKFQQNFTLIRSFQYFVIKFLKKRFLTRLVGEENVMFFLLALHLSIDPSNLANENDVIEISELQMLV